MVSPIVTRGFGANQKIVAQGFGPALFPPLETCPVIPRGFGPDQKIVTLGFCGDVPEPPAPIVPDIIGGGGAKIGRRQPQSVLYSVKACLVEINEKMVQQEICGIRKKTVSPNERDPMVRVRLKNNSISKGRSGIFIKAKLLRQPKEDSDDGESA